MALVSADRIKRFLGLAHDDETHDILIAEITGATLANVGSELHRQLAYEENITEFHSGDGTPEILLRVYPIDTTKTIQLWDDPNRDFGDATLIPSTDYIVDAETGLLRLRVDVFAGAGSFSKAFKNVKVIYTGGYQTLPEDLEFGIAMYTAADFIEGQNHVLTTSDVASVNRISGLRKRARVLVSPYMNYATLQL